MSRILVIEHDSRLRTELRTALKQAGHDIIEASNGMVGLEQFRACNPDLVLTEVTLPEKGGLEVIAEIQADRPQTKVLATSQAHVDRGVNLLQIAKVLGASRTFQKPFEVTEVIEAINDELMINRG